MSSFLGFYIKLTLRAAGDCFVRELDFSRITLRLQERQDKKGGDVSDHTVAKLTGNTMEILRQGLVGIFRAGKTFCMVTNPRSEHSNHPTTQRRRWQCQQAQCQ